MLISDRVMQISVRKFESGERYVFLLNDEGIPDFWVTHFVSSRLRMNKAWTGLPLKHKPAIFCSLFSQNALVRPLKSLIEYQFSWYLVPKLLPLNTPHQTQPNQLRLLLHPRELLLQRLRKDQLQLQCL